MSRFVYDVEEDVAVQRQYVMQVTPSFHSFIECMLVVCLLGSTLRNVFLQGSLGRFREGYFPGTGAADQTSYASSGELAQNRSPEFFCN